MKIKSTFLGVLALAATSVFSQQEQNWKTGEVLIQLDNNRNAEALYKEFSSLSLTNATLLSSHMNVWHYTFDNTETTMEEAIQQLYSSSHVVTVQKNHILTSRAVPNDTEYDEQWQYHQDNDKDIDADEAWDVATGGLTANGDTIVVCVIDDGVNFSHPDLIPNLWVNHNEIPGNGIDDDGNGYVDDVRGWNPSTDNDNVEHTEFWEGHGSAVAGIVGAKGNEGAGVTGVNWDIKIMVVKGGGAEAQAIAAYSYALENRKLYNSTNGDRGAFVVATNASWGIDGGMADEAPLWCAMYDTLGNYGVLNAGATVNGNVNVDVDGDLPTQCASEFLISVTNTDITDNKVTSAGYGAESIDLGAPGAGTWTVDQFSNGFAGFGGTSGATPHVAGTIGLMYSIACKDFADFAISNPKEAAAQIKDFILSGVDPNTSLDGITTTGGRLNVNNSIQALSASYGCGSAALTENSSNLEAITLYPNPIQDNLIHIAYTASISEEVAIIVTDFSGKTIVIQSTEIYTGTNNIQLDLPELATGVYNLQIVSSTSTTTLKFTK